MIFSNVALRAAIANGDLRISPLDDSSIDKAHVDLHIDIADSAEALSIPARGFIIARTLETITLSPKLCAFMEGRSSLARLGLSIEQSSTFIEPGSNNKMVLEIYNASSENIVLKHGQPIAKLFVVRVTDTY